MIARFTVPGPPQGKGRPRFTRTGHAFTPAKTAEYERQIRQAYTRQCGQTFPEDAALRVKIVAWFSVPASDSKARRDMKLKHKMLPIKKPDWDNIGKVICDALNGLAYRDDSQIVDGRVIKVYGEQPKVTVIIEAIEADNTEPQHDIPTNTEKPRRAACKRSHGASQEED